MMRLLLLTALLLAVPSSAIARQLVFTIGAAGVTTESFGRHEIATSDLDDANPWLVGPNQRLCNLRCTAYDTAMPDTGTYTYTVHHDPRGWNVGATFSFSLTCTTNAGAGPIHRFCVDTSCANTSPFPLLLGIRIVPANSAPDTAHICTLDAKQL